jgi:hypothetical protein
LQYQRGDYPTAQRRQLDPEASSDVGIKWVIAPPPMNEPTRYS